MLFILIEMISFQIEKKRANPQCSAKYVHNKPKNRAVICFKNNLKHNPNCPNYRTHSIKKQTKAARYFHINTSINSDRFPPDYSIANLCLQAAISEIASARFHQYEK